jgi:hypothetical protein
LYGGTSLPIWKVYGAAPGEKAYENLGTYKLLIKKLENAKDRIELFGVKIKYPAGINPWLVVYWYVLYKIDLDDKNSISKKYYAIIRTGTNSGSSFTSNYEGSQTIELGPEENLLTYINGEK